ncbi:TonB-dependent receptor [Flavitalea sp. BT771]|uniref:TonB-dependent receptor n=1 Tax=Flavitalea sp. BT771 TaxID=3063329 RepID=UPI0026E32BF0|nr:TonB-dependent receptor [Flavitalea sp. BT771]MDO6435272.1 TonB-dependent receptor [Flavitalea sp. BT771]MDV6224023.1 TonB-dependent receptor [Flavitalea sp. BT771]
MNRYFTAGLTVWLSLHAYASFSQQATRENQPDTVAAPVNLLQQLIVSGSRTVQKRTEAPIAISIVNAQTIKDTKANQLDQLLNKVTGVFMVDLGNEQHEMSIRQPMSTQSLFLYLEDGLPIRTTGVYNHNALLEMNMTATRQMEIIRGPASSLYGAEAIGGAVNVITQAPPASANAYASVQGNNNGYKRADGQAGVHLGKWGVVASGYYASRTNGPIQYSDFHKTALTVRADYKASDRLTWSNSLTYVDYYSDMYGSLDSAHFAQKNYHTPYSFTYRKVRSLRARSQLDYQWNSHGATRVIIAYRDNSIGQNPSYYIKNNASDPSLADGQVNNSAFHSYLALVQHQQQFSWLGSKLIAGISADISPSTYVAHYIRIRRDGKGNYLDYTPTDSLLSHYATGIDNFASYVHYEMAPVKGLRAIAALRYDLYHYNFRNHLPPSASTGSADTRNDFRRATPKLGLTYNYKQLGFYVNYSQGYVPPQVTELYNGVKVPYLRPQTFYNYEAGGWLSLLDHRLYADWSIYRLNGSNQIISVKQSDGTFLNQNAGKTRHEGIEYGLNFRPSAQWALRVSASNASHVFVVQYENNKDYSGNQMSAAPRFIANAELTWRPAFLKGFRLSVEGQHLGKYWMDNANTRQYKGFDIVNFRTGYQHARWEVWVNALNAFNEYYASLASKSSYGYSYNLGDPVEVTVGLAWHFGKL